MSSSNRKAQTGAVDPTIQRIAEEDPVRWWRKPNLRSLYLMLLPTCIGIEITSGFDSQMINALQIVPAWQDYFSDRDDGSMSGELRGIIASVYWLGALMALPFVGIVNDKLGRRWPVFGGSLIMVIGAVIQGCSVNVAMYIVARLLLGFGLTPCLVSASSLVGELGYPKERAFLTSYLSVAYYPGQILGAAVVFGTNNIAGDYAWRIPSWLQAAPSLVQLALVMILPESPRYLVSKDRHEEAFDILVKYHAEGDRESQFVKAEFAHMRTTIELEMGFAKRSYWDIVRTAGMRRRTLISAGLGMFCQWSGNTLISYYLSEILDMIGLTDSVLKQQVNLGISFWSLFCGVIIVMTCVNMRRVKAAYITVFGVLGTFIAYTIGMQQSMEATEAGGQNRAANVIVLVFIFLYRPAYQIFYNALTYTYLIEIWPYAERSRGIAVHLLADRSAGFVTTFVNPVGLSSIGWRFFIVYIVIVACEGVFVYFLFPETHGRTLEELTFLFEDKDLAEQANSAALKAIGDSRVENVEETDTRKV